MIALVSPSQRRVELGGDAAVSIGESESLLVEGLGPGDLVRFGPVSIAADDSGVARVAPIEHEALQCHVGIIPLHLPDGRAVDVDVRPGKIREEAYRALRKELEDVWLGLTLDPESPAAVPARRGPPPAELWEALAPLVRDIARQPRRTLQPDLSTVEVSRLRTLAGVSPAAAARIRLGARTVWGRTTRLETSVDDLAVVVETMLRLAAKARRWDDRETEEDVLAHVRRPPLLGVGPSSEVTHGSRHDPRYRAVLRIRGELDDPAAVITEGPGDLRLGVRAMDRLFEYWVFLRTALAAIERFGPPDPLELSQLTSTGPGGTARLDLAPGTTLSFANGAQIAFEPAIRHDPRESWAGLELPVHPDSRYLHSLATPDIVVLAGSPPRALVIDAKYRARHHVELAAVEVHGKYSRIRRHGRGVVDKVIAVHPHRGYAAEYAGYGHLGWCPGEPLPDLPWDDLIPRERRQERRAVEADTSGELLATALDGHDGPVIVADQKWMRDVIGTRRIDLREVARQLDPDARPFILMPAIGALAGFVAACERAGWYVISASRDRHGQLSRLRSLVDAVGSRPLVVLSGDEAFVATATLAPSHRVVDDLEDLDVWFGSRG